MQGSGEVTQHLPPNSPIFARPREFDIACPGCDKVEAVTKATPARVWQPRHARYCCPRCGLVYYIGLVVWSAKGRGGVWRTPPDQVPTRAQAFELRQRVSVWVEAPKKMAGEEMNARGELLSNNAEEDEA